MGRRGPAPMPTALKVLSGSAPSRINDAEPQPIPGVPDPPAILTASGKRFWADLVKQLRHMRVLTTADAPMLALLCNAYADVVDANRTLRRHGKYRLDESGHPGTRSPALLAKRDAEATVVRLSREFGLTPSSRGTLVVPPETSTGEAPESLLS
jgi:P27 family predicted phage terminase small subunit